jgi:hypothetical protein
MNPTTPPASACLSANSVFAIYPLFLRKGGIERTRLSHSHPWDPWESWDFIGKRAGRAARRCWRSWWPGAVFLGCAPRGRNVGHVGARIAAMSRACGNSRFSLEANAARVRSGTR